jgi:microcystin-dependent protein
MIVSELPIGTILLYSGNIKTLIDSTPRWLLCDGSEVSRSMYQDLFNVIGVTYGSGNSYDTFTLPDFRARFPLGSNDSNNESLVAGGASTHVLTVAEMPTHTHGPGSLQILSNGQHTHTYVDPGHNHGGSTGSSAYSSGTFAFVGGGGLGDDHGFHSHTISTGTTGIIIQPDGNHTHVLQGITDSQGANQSIYMMPPYQTIHYIIQASKSTYFAPSNEKLIVILLFFLTMNLYIYKEECLSI